jgi:CheY-like chemotaxis protein
MTTKLPARAAPRAAQQIAPGDHLCTVHASAEDQRTIVGSFFRAGLARGARCCYIAHARKAADVAAMLEATGIDVRRERRRGALVLASTRDAYLATGHFDPDRTIDSIGRLTNEARENGFSSLYVTGEMTWALAGDPGSERLVEYEARVASAFQDGTVAGLCQYDRRRFPPELLRDLVRTHPLVAFPHGMRANGFFEPDTARASSTDAAAAVQRMLSDIEAGTLAPEPAARPRRAATRIMVVEPHVALREALALAFQHYGYDVASAASWVEANALARSGPRPRLLLLGVSRKDCERPGLLAVDELSQVPTILLSSGAMPPAAARLRAVVAILPKSSSLEEIMSVVEGCLDRRSSAPVMLPS